METSLIVSIVSAVFSSAASIVSVISFFLSTRNSRPRIKVDIKSNDCEYMFFTRPDGSADKFGYMVARIQNQSPTGGTLAGVELIYNKKSYTVETVGMMYSQDWYKISLGSKVPQDSEFFRLKVPLPVAGYAAIMGYFIFPEFPVVPAGDVKVALKLKFAENRLKVKYIKNIVFSDSASKSLKYHYENEINGYKLYSLEDYKITLVSSVMGPKITTNDSGKSYIH